MDSSSEDDTGFVRRKSSSKNILDSDDENYDINEEERTEDFKLRLSDEDDDGESIGAKIAASLADPLESSVQLSDSVFSKNVDSSESRPQNPSSDESLHANGNTLQPISNQKVTKTTCIRGTEAIMKTLSALADSDSESDEENTSSQHRTEINSTPGTLQSDSDDNESSEANRDGLLDPVQSSKSKKEKCGPARKSKTNAKNAMLEIKAESQRQLRQSKIGLPYHVPKQRSLLDFLNRRKSASPMPIKGPVEQLATAWKQIEEREKEVELFYKSESDNESDADTGDDMCSSSEKQLDNKLDTTATNQNEEEPGNQLHCVESSESSKKLSQHANDVDNIETTEKEISPMPLDAAKTLKLLNGDMDSGLETPSNHNHNSTETDNTIDKSVPQEIKPEDSENIPATDSRTMVETIDEYSSAESEPLEAMSERNGISVKGNCHSGAIAVCNLLNNPFENCDQSQAQENESCLKDSVDHVKSHVVHTFESQSVSLFPSETQTQLETSSTHQENKSCNVLTASADEECIIEKDKEPAKLKDQSVVADDCCNLIQDSQDINLHYSETQSHVGECEKQSVIPDDKVMCQTKEIGEGNAVNRQTLNWDELDAAIRNDEHSDTEDISDSKAQHNKQLMSAGPRLSLKGDPNSIIDLDDMNSKPSAGVKGLIERFMKHSASKKKPALARTVELSVISSARDTSGDVTDLKQESVKICLNGDEDYRTENNITPGARLKLLKTELNHQMRKLKEEEWQKKMEEMKNEKYFTGEKDVCDGLPDEEDEEEEMTDSEAESEPEINDVREPKKKKKTKSLFVDEEAEVEDDCNESGLDDETQDDGINGDDEEDDGDDDVNNSEDGEESDEENDCDDDKSNSDSVKSTGQKTMSGTVADELLIHKDLGKGSGSLQRTMTSVSDLFASQSNEWTSPADEDDDFIPPGQPNGVVQRDQFTQKSDESKESSIFLSPSLSIPGKASSFMETNHELTPLKCSWPIESTSPSIKRLFSEAEPESTQEKLAELAGLFGDKFKDSQASLSVLTNTSTNSETDLMALCSGKFVTQVPKPIELEGECTQPLGSSVSQSSSQMSKADESYSASHDAADSVDFSLKWDDDAREDAKDGNTEANENFRLEIVSSDEEEATLLRSQKKKKKQKLQFSDDEEEAEQENDLESLGSDLSEINDEEDTSNNGNPKLFGVFNKPSKEVFYDSDENEIEAGDFLEKEAELSEEEDWRGSEDEDEKGLDQLEMDEADKEDIDQDLVREELVKNNVQKMLDEDRRDVRILQEMLLEDGDLHSDAAGRERQFRWRNVDSTGMEDDKQLSDEEHVDQEEDEDDAEWRKQRHEREMFLKEQREKHKKEADSLEDDDEVLENSELLQLGKSVLFKSRSNSLDLPSEKDQQPLKFSAPNPLLSPDGKRPNALLLKRGSFLSRGDNVLAKLAKFSGSSKENVLAGAKNSGNFVFSSKSPSKKESQPEADMDSKSSKRKATVGLQNATEKKQCVIIPSTKRSGLFDHL